MGIGVNIDSKLGLGVGLEIGHAGATLWGVDGSSGIALPVDGTEAAALLSAAGAPGNILAVYRFGSVASGDITDDSGNGKTLADGGANAGTIAYEQPVTAWDALAVTLTGASSQKFTNGTFPAVASNDFAIYLWAKLTTTPATHTIMRYGDVYLDDVNMSVNSTPRLSCGEGDGTQTLGAESPIGAVRPFVLVGAATVLASTDQEKITVGTRAANGTEVNFGGDNVQTDTAPPIQLVFAMIVDAAHTFAQQKAVLEQAGWTVPWSP